MYYIKENGKFIDSKIWQGIGPGGKPLFTQIERFSFRTLDKALKKFMQMFQGGYPDVLMRFNHCDGFSIEDSNKNKILETISHPLSPGDLDLYRVRVYGGSNQEIKSVYERLLKFGGFYSYDS